MNKGTFIISLDFELCWGMRDLVSVSHLYAKNFLGAREAIPRMLDLFAKYGIAATWGTVGMLFAESKEELLSYIPEIKPNYVNKKVNPYLNILDEVGENEKDDPYHYAPSLIKLIASYPRQEIGSHTFSHYYWLERGQDVAAFRSDMESAVKIARAHNYNLCSFIAPRAQNTYKVVEYLRVLSDLGFVCYRSENFLHRKFNIGLIDQGIRLMRFTNSFSVITGFNTYKWKKVALDKKSGLITVPGSMFMRARPNNLPIYNQLHLKKIRCCMKYAAKNHRIFHIWWHPHNFGAEPDWSLQMLEDLLKYYSRLRDTYGFESLNMIETAERVK